MIFVTPEVVGATVYKVVGALILPPGLATGVGTTVTVAGGAAGTLDVPAGQSEVYFEMIEGTEAGVFAAVVTFGGTALPDAVDAPYTFKAKQTASGAAIPDYATLAGAYLFAADVLYSRDVPTTIKGGMLKGGEWTTAADVVKVNGDDAVPDPTGGGIGSGDTSINHDGATGVTVAGGASGADVMRVVDEGGAPVDDAEISAYLASDYDAGRKGPAYRQAFVRTGSDGRWVQSIMLDAGSYTFEASHDNLGVVTFDVEVP